MSSLNQKRIDHLSRLLDRADAEKDTDAVAALRWAIFTLENIVAAFEEHEQEIESGKGGETTCRSTE